MTPPLETPRLLLRPLELADAAQVQLLFPHWEIVRHLAGQVPWPYPADAAYLYIRDFALPAVQRGEAWHWTLRLKSNPGQLVGSIDLRKKENDNRGFWLGLPWQRQGLMTEACDAVTDFWFNTLHFPVLRAPKAIANVACGNTFQTRSTMKGEMLRVEICSSCHPFFTGKQKLVDTAGRVERFQKKYADAAAKSTAAKK